MSDLDGTDPNILGGTVEGVMRELCNAFMRRRGQRRSVPEMMQTYRRVADQVDRVLKNAGTQTLFEAQVFDDLSFLAFSQGQTPQLTNS